MVTTIVKMEAMKIQLDAWIINVFQISSSKILIKISFTFLLSISFNRCSNGLCLTPNKLCNKVNDCEDGADEELESCKSSIKIYQETYVGSQIFNLFLQANATATLNLNVEMGIALIVLGYVMALTIASMDQTKQIAQRVGMFLLVKILIIIHMQSV